MAKNSKFVSRDTASRRRATGLDVAGLAKVSKSTVSRVFNGGFVSPEVRQRILDAASTLHYRPNPTARSLTMQRSNLIGVAITYMDNQLYPELVQKLSDRFAELNYRIVLFITHGEQKRDPSLEEIMSYSLDAIIFSSSSYAAKVALGCEQAGIPTVMFNSIDLDESVKCISTDDQAGARELAQLMLKAGHQRFAIISGLDESSTNHRRCQAFCDEITAAGFSHPTIVCGHFTFAGAQQASRELLSAEQAPEAIFCINDHMALACLQVAAEEFALVPGKDISIVGFDDVTIANWPAFNLTTYAHPLNKIIERMIAYITDQLAGKNQNKKAEFIAGRLVVRGSCLSIK
jgi:DNA-binding LacI/PurR family transcriptional regulator